MVDTLNASLAAMRRPVWQRALRLVTTLFTVALLSVAFQWNTSTPLAPGLALRPLTAQQPVSHPDPLNVQFGEHCLDTLWQAKAIDCPLHPAAFRPRCIAFAREACLLS
jgi:hypothetical protein